MVRALDVLVGHEPGGDGLAGVLDARVRPASLAHPEGDGVVRCVACGHRCLVRPGRRGICKVRFNQGRPATDRARFGAEPRTMLGSTASSDWKSPRACACLSVPKVNGSPGIGRSSASSFVI